MPAEQEVGLEQAWVAWVAGDREHCIRAAIAILESDTGQLGAAHLLAEAVADAAPDAAGAALERLVEALIRRGDLPRALACARVAEPTSADADALRVAIAKAFSSQSKRTAKDVAPAPPPLPITAPLDAELAGAEGEGLLELAQAALKAFVAAPDEVDEASKVPKMPLFSALPTIALASLLEVWELREIGEGDAAIEEGTDGTEAFLVVRGHLRAQRGEGGDAVVLADLGPGALFGEMALVSEAPRAASVVALEPVQLLVAKRVVLERLAKKTPQIGAELSAFCSARMVANLVRHSAILGAVEPKDRRALMKRFAQRSFKRGEKLVTHGEETEGLFLIASGAVDVRSLDGDGDELVVAQLGPGDVVGEISLVLRRPATADVVATHPTVALELRREPFQEAIKEHPGLLGELYDLATKREEEMRTVVAQETLDVEDIVLL